MYPNPRKRKVYVHNPTTLKVDDVTISISSDGKVTLIQEGKEDGQPVEDEVTTSAAAIFQIAALLEATRKVKYVDYDNRTDPDKF